jgi:hypothetical protein
MKVAYSLCFLATFAHLVVCQTNRTLVKGLTGKFLHVTGIKGTLFDRAGELN